MSPEEQRRFFEGANRRPGGLAEALWEVCSAFEASAHGNHEGYCKAAFEIAFAVKCDALAHNLTDTEANRPLTLREGLVFAGVDEEIGLDSMLPIVESLVTAAEREQFRVGTALDDLTLLHHQDLVGVDDGRQPVGDDEGGSSLLQSP